jgi:multiple sugar transport system permease protein
LPSYAHGFGNRVRFHRPPGSAILTVRPAWNQYLWPVTVAQKEELRPVMVATQSFQPPSPWGEVTAPTSLVTLPVLIVFLVFPRAFVSSIAASGVKG